MTSLFLDKCPRKNPKWENRCNYSKGLLLCNISLSTTGCQTGSPDKDKYLAAIPLYLEICIQKTCPTKPSSTTLKLYASPSGLCVNLLRHCATSGTLCITPAALYVDDTIPLGSALSLLGSTWPALAAASCSLPLRWSLGIVSTSLSSTHYPLMLIIDSTLLSNPALANQMTDHFGVFSN